MKEVDFLPEWYKSGRRRQISYRTQYVILGSIFATMVVWNFIAAHSASKVAAELARLEAKQTQGQKVSEEFRKIKKQVTQLQKKEEFIEEIDSKIRVGDVLAELSFLVDERIVLSKVDFKAERFLDSKKRQTGSDSTVIAASSAERGGFDDKEALSLGDVRFKVVISGVAADASDVAELVCRLEDSPYFQLVYPLFSRNLVYPSFSRNKEIKVTAGLAKQDFGMTEFEISCYLANYQQTPLEVSYQRQLLQLRSRLLTRQEEPYLAKKSPNEKPER